MIPYISSSNTQLALMASFLDSFMSSFRVRNAPDAFSGDEGRYRRGHQKHLTSENIYKRKMEATYRHASTLYLVNTTTVTGNKCGSFPMDVTFQVHRLEEAREKKCIISTSIRLRKELKGGGDEVKNCSPSFSFFGRDGSLCAFFGTDQLHQFL